MSSQLKMAFPEKFSDSESMNYLIMLRDKILAECNFVLTGDVSYLSRVKETMEYFLSLLQPRNMDGNSSENYMIRQRKNFEQICVMLMEKGMHNPDEMTVFRFHTAISYFEKKAKPDQD